MEEVFIFFYTVYAAVGGVVLEPRSELHAVVVNEAVARAADHIQIVAGCESCIAALAVGRKRRVGVFHSCLAQKHRLDGGWHCPVAERKLCPYGSERCFLRQYVHFLGIRLHRYEILFYHDGFLQLAVVAFLRIGCYGCDCGSRQYDEFSVCIHFSMRLFVL